MPFDGKEHAHAEHDNLERDENYWEPIHDFFSINRLLLDAIHREGRLCKVPFIRLHDLFKPPPNLPKIITFPSLGIA